MDKCKRTCRYSFTWLTLSVLLLSISAACKTAKPKSLPSFNIDRKEISVSGLSSGAHMAVQFDVAYSSLIKGAGIIAGGPYDCAQNDIGKAMSACTCTNPMRPCNPYPGITDVQRLVQITRDDAGSGKIDDVSNLSHHRIFLFSGTKDKVVPQIVMNDLDSYYRNFVPEANIQYKRDIPAQHSITTDSYGNECDHLGVPFINNCRYDTAGELLKQIHGELKPRNTGTLSGSFIEFDQGEFIEKPESHSMDKTGWVYVPGSCRAGQKCRLHIAFHGCLQGQTVVGRQFIEHAGYNEWADANTIVVLYPQVVPRVSFGVPGSVVADLNNTNPQGCWNWWGYDKDLNYAVKSGHQMTAVKAMIDRIAGKSEAE